MAHAANAEVSNSHLGPGINPNVAAEAAGILYDQGLDDKEYDYVLHEGVSEPQRDQLAQAIHPEGEIIKYFDPATGLSNKYSFMEARARADQDADTVFVEFDLNNLKQKNIGGHEYGDVYIYDAARALSKAGSEFGLTNRNIFRVGGDEFVAVIAADQAEAFELRTHELFKDYMSAIGQTYSEADKRLMAKKAERDSNTDKS